MPRPDVLVFDTSALMLPFDLGIDIEAEAKRLFPGTRLVIPSPMMDELAHLAAQGRGTSKRHAKMALTYALRFEEYKIGGRGDDVVIQTGRRFEADGATVAVATGDQKLRFRARKKGWPVLTVRGHRAYLDGLVE